MLFADKRALETNLQVWPRPNYDPRRAPPPPSAQATYVLSRSGLASQDPREGAAVLHAELHRHRHAGGAALGLRVQRHHPGRHTRGVERCPQGALPVRDDCGDGLRADRGAQQHALLHAGARPRAPRARWQHASRSRRPDARVGRPPPPPPLLPPCAPYPTPPARPHLGPPHLVPPHPASHPACAGTG